MIKHISRDTSKNEYELVTSEQMRQLDQKVMEQYGVDLLQMMELAGLTLAQLVVDTFYKGEKLSVLVAAGTGNNGGGGMVAARHLANWGHQVSVLLSDKTKLTHAPLHQMKTLKQMEINFFEDLDNVAKDVLIIDALLGYGQVGKVRTPLTILIEKINSLEKPIVALDNPSGLNIDTGLPSNSTIKASISLTLAALKKGLMKDNAKRYVGDLYIADIGIPKKAYNDLGVAYPF